MRLFFTPLLFITTLLAAFGQKPLGFIDSLKTALTQTRQDTSRVLLLTELAANYQFFKSDTAIKLAREAIALAEKIDFAKGKIRSLTRLGEVLRMQGEYPQALEVQLKALQLSRQTHDLDEEANTLSFAGIVYTNLGENRQGLNCFLQARNIYEQKAQQLHEYRGSNLGISYDGYRLSNTGNAYKNLGKLDSALYFQLQALSLQSLYVYPLRALILTRLGEIQQRLGSMHKALGYYQEALRTATGAGDLLNMASSSYQVAAVYESQQRPDSSIHYAQLAFRCAQKAIDKSTLLKSSSLLAQLYKSSNKLDSAFHFQQIAIATKDSMFGPEKFRRLQLITLAEQQRVQQLHQEQQQSKERLERMTLVGVLGVFLLIALLLWRNNRQQQRVNYVLSQKNTQIEEQRHTLEQTLTELRITQVQLIQKEKLASLGELTAGIAHEIQNPLNFVNNFSEVSTELVEELKGELNKGDVVEAGAIADDLSQNLQKITHHGQRASSIVKGMLEHSRAGTGERQPTNLNALADEYLRLAYQGMRAKDKDFNCELVTDFDPDLGLVELVPQEIGRVLLNLFNNAFYAVNQRKAGSREQELSYKPTVWFSTKRLSDAVEIRVRDNGIGIPPEILTKIYQPFFTTKPTGEGTGLGLSLSYEIITKGHGGTLTVESMESEGTEFSIDLPS